MPLKHERGTDFNGEVSRPLPKDRNGLNFGGEDGVFSHLLSVTRTVAPCSKGMREVWYLHPKQWRHFEWDQVFFLSFSRALQGGLDNAGWHPITCCCKMRVTEQQGKDDHACTTHQEHWGLSIWNSSKGWLMQGSESLNTKGKKPGSLAIWRSQLLFCCINDRGKWCIITIFVPQSSFSVPLVRIETDLQYKDAVTPRESF